MNASSIWKFLRTSIKLRHFLFLFRCRLFKSWTIILNLNDDPSKPQTVLRKFLNICSSPNEFGLLLHTITENIGCTINILLMLQFVYPRGLSVLLDVWMWISGTFWRPPLCNKFFFFDCYSPSITKLLAQNASLIKLKLYTTIQTTIQKKNSWYKM